MASSKPVDDDLTPAQRMMAQHSALEPHQPTVEDVVDEEDIAHPVPANITNSEPSLSPHATNGVASLTKASGKQKASGEDNESAGAQPALRTRNAPPLDTFSQDAFPSLAAPKASGLSAGKWNNKPTLITANGPGTAPSGPTHLKMPMNSGRSVNLPGQASNSMAIQTRLLAPQRGCQHKTIAELLKYINKKFRVTVQTSNADGKTNFNATGPTHEVVNKALREIAALWGAQQTVEVSVPTSVLPQIIGRQGTKIKELQERTGARIHTSRNANKESNIDGSEDSKIEIHGNPLTAEAARREIQAIVGERTSSVNLKLLDIPPELYPFLAGPHNCHITALEGDRDVRINIPHYHKSSGTIPEHAAHFAPQRGYHITIQGERDAANQAQLDIQHQAEQLRAILALQQLDIEREKHRAVLDGEQSLHNFMDRTGCSIVMPATGSDSEAIAVIGPPDRLQTAVDYAMDLALSMHMTSIDVSRHHANAPNGASTHAMHVARYLQHNQALADLERVHNANIVVPEGTGLWQIYSRDGKMAIKARTDITNIILAHPPTRFRSLDVDPFYQGHIESDHAHVVRDRYGVRLVFTEPKTGSSPVLLVCEQTDPSAFTEAFDLPRSKPSAADAATFQERLTEAEKYLLGLFDPTTEIVSDSIDAPSKYQDKLRRHVDARAKQSQNRFPVHFMGFGPSSATSESQASVSMRFRGPAPEVSNYRQSLVEFIEEQIRDEAERDYTTTCDFPQKHANQLIGRKGENINRLRMEHDVEIQINDGKVEIKGPERKAHKAKAEILSLARKAEDETTLIIKMKPQFHGNIIGSGGATPRKLQERYRVQISFPRAIKDDQSLGDNASDAGAQNKGKRAPQAADEVIIRGPSKGATEARKELEDLYDYVVKNSHAASVSVAQSLIPSLIGSGGKELESLRLETGAKIDIPGAKGDSDPTSRVEIQLRGTKEQVDKAKKAIQGRAKIHDDSIRRTIQVDKKHHRALIGRNGDNIMDLVTKAGGSAEERSRLVRFPPADSHDRNIQLDGNASVVNQLAAAIEAFVLSREQQVEDTVSIPPERHGALIGTGGEMRKRLESELRVSITIPDRNVTGPARSAVRISGLPADVERAKAHISEMVKGQERETLEVPIHMHHAIFSANNSKLRDLNVRVDHAGRQRPPRPSGSNLRSHGADSSSMPLITDPSADKSSLNINDHHAWNIAGPTETTGDEAQTIPWVFKSGDADSVVQARELIEAAIKAERQASTGYLVLPDPSMHQYVIGPRGSTINNIRKDTGCDIDVPKKGGSSEVIAIKGQRDATEAAKEMIIEAVSNGLSR